ncbi:MAG TPA: hypothetical protein VHM64_13065, partial [Candidatus Binatia bacterium]|nr:hypothetical protein [Candidatus Binatia bacterium]
MKAGIAPLFVGLESWVKKNNAATTALLMASRPKSFRIDLIAELAGKCLSVFCLQITYTVDALNSMTQCDGP